MKMEPIVPKFEMTGFALKSTLSKMM